MTRLKYETSGGAISKADTFAQLLEYTRLAEEDMRLLGRLRKIANDDLTSNMWIACADRFAKIQQVISHLGNSKTRFSVGYRSAKPANRS